MDEEIDRLVVSVRADTAGFARDVDTMLHRIAVDQGGLDEAGAQAWVDDLRRGDRYLRDAY